MLLLFFSILGEWGGWVLKSMENSILFLFFIFDAFPKRFFDDTFFGGSDKPPEWTIHLMNHISGFLNFQMDYQIKW